MSLFDHVDFDQHEHVSYVCDPDSGLRAIIAIHNTHLGPAMGGTRYYPYQNDADALTDVLRLSRGMTYKSALARLPLGGGKSVIIGDPKTQKTPAQMHAFGRFLERLGGLYIAAEDSGTSVADMKIVREVTEHVSGCDDKQTIDGHTKSGDPSPATAYGCFLGIQAAVKYRLKRDDLNGLTVGIQGLGNVGYRLADMLAEAGAHLIVTDINADTVHRAERAFDARAVGLDDIYSQPMDIFAPCALGATVNPHTLEQLQASIIAGSANNQLDTAETGRLVHAKGLCYAPDYVINAGGIIDVYYEKQGHYNTDTVNEHIEGIFTTLMALFERSKRDNIATSDLADTMARERLQLADTASGRRTA